MKERETIVKKVLLIEENGRVAQSERQAQQSLLQEAVRRRRTRRPFLKAAPEFTDHRYNMRNTRNPPGKSGEHGAFRRVACHDIGPHLPERIHKTENAALIGDRGEALAKGGKLAEIGLPPCKSFGCGFIIQFRGKTGDISARLTNIIYQRADIDG